MALNEQVSLLLNERGAPFSTRGQREPEAEGVGGVYPASAWEPLEGIYEAKQRMIGVTVVR